MNSPNIPIIKLEIQGMKHTIQAALTARAAQLDTSLQAAVEAYCTDENIEYIVKQEVTTALNAAIKEEIRSYFQWSKPGRQAVREAVIAHLDQWEKTHREIETGAS